jgi:hypothetical protein
MTVRFSQPQPFLGGSAARDIRERAVRGAETIAQARFAQARRMGRNGLVAALMCTSGAVPAWSQDVTAPYTETRTVSAAADITTLPDSGVGGRSGRAGYYSCNQMTWGLACAAFYSFGSFSTTGASNGANAPVGGTVADVSSDQPEIVSIVDYDPATVTSPGFTVTVTQLAGSVDTKLVSAGAGLTAADYVNGGAAFYLEGTTQDGTPFTVQFAESATGTPPNVVYTGGWTLADVATAINAEDLGLLASVEADPVTGDLALVVAGAAGDGRDFSLGAFTDISLGGQSVDQSLADLAFGAIATKTDPVQAEYTVTGSVSGNGSFQSDMNEITVDGITVQLADLGTSTLSTSQLQAGVGAGARGNSGVDGIAISHDLLVSQISVGETAYDLSTTGGYAGQAGQGGQGGSGGAGGQATTGTVPRLSVIIFPPLVLPWTGSFALQGGIGGTGGTGGTGGIGEKGGIGGGLHFSLDASTVTADVIFRGQSTGGIGGIGGQGGLGGTGGAGADAVAAVQSSNLLPELVSAAGNTGGIGGVGGIGGLGGTGGAGGVVDVSFAMGQAQADRRRRRTRRTGRHWWHGWHGWRRHRLYRFRDGHHQQIRQHGWKWWSGRSGWRGRHWRRWRFCRADEQHRSASGRWSGCDGDQPGWQGRAGRHGWHGWHRRHRWRCGCHHQLCNLDRNRVGRSRWQCRRRRRCRQWWHRRNWRCGRSA